MSVCFGLGVIAPRDNAQSNHALQPTAGGSVRRRGRAL